MRRPLPASETAQFRRGTTSGTSVDRLRASGGHDNVVGSPRGHGVDIRVITGLPPAYEPCIPNLEGDSLNCGDLGADQKPVRVIEPAVDPFRLDGDNDGVGCEEAESARNAGVGSLRPTPEAVSNTRRKR